MNHKNANGIPHPQGGGGYGVQLKEDYRRLYGAVIGLSGRGEMIARRDNRCTIDPHQVDQYGIVRRGKALLSCGCETHLTTVVPVSSDQSDLWR